MMKKALHKKGISGLSSFSITFFLFTLLFFATYLLVEEENKRIEFEALERDTTKSLLLLRKEELDVYSVNGSSSTIDIYLSVEAPAYITSEAIFVNLSSRYFSKQIRISNLGLRMCSNYSLILPNKLKLGFDGSCISIEEI